MNNPRNPMSKATIKEFEKFIEAEKKPRCCFCGKPLVDGYDNILKRKSKYIKVCTCNKWKKAGVRMSFG